MVSAIALGIVLGLGWVVWALIDAFERLTIRVKDLERRDK